MTARKWLFGLLLLGAMWLAPYQTQRAHATTMTAAVTCVIGPCFNDSGIRTNFVGVLGFNRYALLPFLFTDANATLTGTVLVADLLLGGNNYIYLYGQGIGVQNTNGGIFLSSAITQSFLTLPGVGAFAAFNVGACNLGATLAGDGALMSPYVNGVGLAGGFGTTACSPFAQFYPTNLRAVGAITNLTATDVMQFNPLGAGVITLPWGDDDPDPSASTLNTDIQNSDSLSTIEADLLALDPSLTQQVPEPATLALFGSGLLGLAALRRKRRAA